MCILTLPPSSPELNPTEQLWDLIRKRRFANKAYDSLDEVEDDPAKELRALEADHTTIQSESLTSHQWITSSLNLIADWYHTPTVTASLPPPSTSQSGLLRAG
jgi:transposase